ncbi:MAG: UDP-N-acetylmuramate dehydrogenase [Candidatus Coatesbacteria bacterium]|nr:UDP-N-acetylmuramate dehydrogenase [Candidatus Coatesbacteria bacterium]
MNLRELSLQLKACHIPRRLEVPLAGYTWLEVGGPADVFVEPRMAIEAATALRLAAEHGAPVLVLGRGTNLLIGDGGFRGMALHLGPSFDDGRVVVEGRGCIAAAGVRLSKLLERLAVVGLGGLEDLYGIPGSLGGALAMNAGAYGSAIWPRVGWIELALPVGRVVMVDAAKIEYGYRSVKLPPGAVVTGARLRLERSDPRELLDRHHELTADREGKHPLAFPNCGSVFKNPSRYNTAARMIEACGLKGRSVGGAKISEKHANFMVNTGGASAADFRALIELVRDCVEKEHGLSLCTEVRLAGEFTTDENDLDDADDGGEVRDGGSA